MKKFTNLYPLSKTLRFELKPIGKTLENIQSSGLLEQDQHRAESYKLVKKLIDEYHKAYIESALRGFKLDESSLIEFFFWYKNTKDSKRSEKLEKCQENLRKQIAKQLTDSNSFKRIDKKELIKEDLYNFLENEADKQLVKEFNEFTTYFTGFHENRKNMYSAEAKSTAIAYRLVHENLPKFIDNISTFEKVAEVPELADKLKELYKNFEEYLNVIEIKDIFSLNYYSDVLTQLQIDLYNYIIGGRVDQDGKNKIQGLNEYINLYNQQQTDKSKRLPKMKPLYKQILSDREAISWLPETFNSPNEVLESIEKCYAQLNENVLADNKLKSLLQDISTFDLDKIYIANDLQLTDISNKVFGSWNVITNAIEKNIKNNNPQGKKESEEKYEEKVKTIFKNSDSFSIAYINDCVRSANDSAENINVAEYFSSLCNENEENIFTRISTAYNQVKDLLNTPYPEGKSLSQDKENVERIKNLLDSIMNLLHYVKPLCGKGNISDKDEKFYGEFSTYWDVLNEITNLYNKVRNYMTKKPYSEEKIKLNFNNSTLLDGWDQNKEKDNTSVILRKDGLYYLAIMNKKYNKVFESKFLKSDGDCYEKMNYKLLPGANKMLPKVFFSNSRIAEFCPSDELMANYEQGTHKKGDNFNISHCHELIDFFKMSINKHEDWKNFEFNFSDTKSYEDLSGFYREVEQQGYKITFSNVSVSYIDQLVEEGKIYLFQIYNKDFSAYSKGTPNMHTIYWKMLFDENNLSNVVYKLNGQAEVFFRKKSITYSEEKMQKGHHYEKLKDKFKYPIIKDRRYAFDKFQFHVPITLNFKAVGNDNINPIVNEWIKGNGCEHIIGIDRGERHLLYLSLIDLKGNVVKQFTLNEIVNEHNGNTYKTDYRTLLDIKEKKRDEERKSWNSIESIKELKEGYLSQVIHKIAEMVVEYNAIVVLEDLNMGFMRGRQKVEKQVYQKFEKMLIEKLNYLVDKKKNPTELGGALNALQLTSKFESFQKMGKQSGILFYVPAWNTSKMDPTTGFVNLLDTKYESVDNARKFFNSFDNIRYNAKKNWFEFDLDYMKFGNKAEGTQTKWTLCTFGNRILTFRNPEKNSEWDNRELVLTEEFKKCFEKHSIDIYGDLKAQISNMKTKEFFSELLNCMKLLLQMRNSITGTETDYLISPVMNSDCEFYDSSRNKTGLPDNADANGAYNIARKGLWVIEQIKNAEDINKIKPAITNKEWMNYAQQKPYLK